MNTTQKILVTVIVVVLFAGIAFCGVSWGLTQQALASVRTELADTQAILESTEKELSDLESDIVSTKAELQNTEAELQNTIDYLSQVEAELQATKVQLSAIQTDALHLHNPIFEEATSFLRKDKTDANEYLEDEYVCSHFARDVNNNAENQGIRCAYVEIRFPESGHAIIAFDTTDNGMVYFDATTDERVRPIIGQEYWQCIEPRPGYYYTKPSYDDTIVDILVIW